MIDNLKYIVSNQPNMIVYLLNDFTHTLRYKKPL